MKLADFPRATNRALIDSLFIGAPPYTSQEAQQNRIQINVNWLDSLRIHQDATRQFETAFGKPGNYFTVKLGSGPAHKRGEWAEIITEEINKRMKASATYTDLLHDVFSQVVLHGVGPVSWPDKQSWCPVMHGMSDVGIPSRTLLTMENLPYFYIDRRYTATELWRKTHGPRVDKGWEMGVVNKAIQWAVKTGADNMAMNDTDYVYAPERWVQDIQENPGYYASDLVPTINCKDFYWLEDSKKEWGWKRRIVLDSPAPSQRSDGKLAASNKSIIDGRNEFIFNPGDRNYASKLSEILHFQFADGSVIAPHRYHTVRSLGRLLYDVCHLQNRLRCKLNEATFEALLNYYRVANPDDGQRPEQLNLIDKGILPEGWNFVPPSERWQVNQGLVQQTMLLNRQSMSENSTSYTQDFGYEQQGGRRGPEKTATQVTAEVNAATAMVGSMLQRAYGYQEGQYREICRRFCIANSKDKDVRAFRAACLRRGVPEDKLVVEQWNVSAVRVVGAGNKQLELSQLQMAMQFIDRLDPDAQRLLMREYMFAAVDNPTFAGQLVPFEKNLTTDSVHDAQMSAATMLLGLQMGLRQGVNHGEYAATLMGAAKNTIDRINAAGGVGKPEDLVGLQNLLGQSVDGQPIEGNGARAHIEILAQNEGSKSEVKQLMDVLGRLLNEVKAFAQRQQEQQARAQEGNGQLPPGDVVALKAKLVMAETDAKIKEAAAQQKAAHKDAQFQQRLAQTQARDEQSSADVVRKAQVGEAALDLETAGKIQRESAGPVVST